MAKAADKAITSWVSLCGAKTMVTKVYQSPRIAERFLLQELAAGRIRWRGLEPPPPLKNGKQSSDPRSGDSNFWEAVTRMDWAENWARYDVAVTRTNPVENWIRCDVTMRTERVVLRSYVLLRIEVALEDVARRLADVAAVDLNAILAPAGSEIRSPDSKVDSKVWLMAEARRMKAAGAIPPGMSKTDFARELERRMQEAAKVDRSIKPIKLRTIVNNA